MSKVRAFVWFWNKEIRAEDYLQSEDKDLPSLFSKMSDDIEYINKELGVKVLKVECEVVQ